MSEETITLEIPKSIFVSFSLSKCVLPEFDGEHQNIELDLSKLTGEMLLAYAQRNIIIRAQTVRTAKEADKYQWLKDKKYIVPEPGERISKKPVSVDTVKNLVNKLTEEQKKEIAKAMGFTYVPSGLATSDPELEAGEV